MSPCLDRGEPMQRYERMTALPMVAASSAFVGLLIFPIVVPVSKALDTDLRAAN